MLSKEEIEKGKAHLKWLLDRNILASKDEEHIEVVLNYIEQLETNHKKLIEYIEKKMSEYDETIIELVLQNVLAVAKGEKE